MKLRTQHRPLTKTGGKRTRLVSRQLVQSYCNDVAREFHPEKNILFGSYAGGKPTPDSDVDLLVILPFRGNDTAKAIQIRSRFDTPFPMDLLVRKPEFIATRLRERDMFVEAVMIQGIVMYESQHARLPSIVRDVTFAP